MLLDISSSTHLKPNTPCSLHQNQISLLSTETEFYKVSSMESSLVPEPRIQSLKGISSFLPVTSLNLLSPLLPLLFRLLHLCYYLLFVQPNTHQTYPLLPVNLLQHHFHLAHPIFRGWGVLPTLLQSGIPVSSQSHLTTFPSLFSLLPENKLSPWISLVYSLFTQLQNIWLWVKCLLCVKSILSFNKHLLSVCSVSNVLMLGTQWWPRQTKFLSSRNLEANRGETLRHHGPSPGYFQSSTKISNESRHP